MIPREALETLLLDLYTPSELRRLVARMPRGNDALRHHLPPRESSPRELADGLVELLQRRRLVDPVFFRFLLRDRPRRRSEIVEVALRFPDLTLPALTLVDTPPTRYITPEGRDEELMRLLEDLAPHHGRGIVCLRGEAGIGKSTLCQALLRRLCDPRYTGDDLAFEAIVWVDGRRDAPRDGTSTLDAALLRRIRETTGQVEKETALDAPLVAELFEEHRILVIIDHFARDDDFTGRLHALRPLLADRRAAGSRFLLVPRADEGDDGAACPLAATTTTLGPLEDPPLRAHLARLSPHASEQDLEDLVQQSCGNPGRAEDLVLNAGRSAEDRVTDLGNGALDLLLAMSLFASPPSWKMLQELYRRCGHPSPETFTAAKNELQEKNLLRAPDPSREDSPDGGSAYLKPEGSDHPNIRDHSARRDFEEHYVDLFHERVCSVVSSTGYFSGLPREGYLEALGPHLRDIAQAGQRAAEQERWEVVRDLAIRSLHVMWEEGEVELRLGLVDRALEAMQHLRRQEQIEEEERHRLEREEALLRIDGRGFVHLVREEYDRTLTILHQGLADLPAGRHPGVRSLALYRIGLIHLRQDSPELAEHFLQRAIRQPGTKGMLGAHASLGYLYLTRGEIQRAEKAFAQYDALAREKGLMKEPHRSFHRSLAARGWIALARRNFDEARGLFAESVECADRNDDRRFIAFSEMSAGILALEEARWRLGRANDWGDRIEYPRLLARARELLEPLTGLDILVPMV